LGIKVILTCDVCSKEIGGESYAVALELRPAHGFVAPEYWEEVSAYAKEQGISTQKLMCPTCAGKVDAKQINQLIALANKVIKEFEAPEEEPREK
jgi:hypothetical protein